MEVVSHLLLLQLLQLVIEDLLIIHPQMILDIQLLDGLELLFQEQLIMFLLGQFNKKLLFL
jgi:hypothetical protein